MKYFEVRCLTQTLVDAVVRRVGSLPVNLAEIKEKFHERADKKPIFVPFLDSKTVR